ncbi:hypothetical protein A4S06_09945 [Erysipelotrichaceae bacterium MTC7]|nr:hypothetical protein A4S06_09945 [Erysipelotrichaceae bacterium MTC7]
MKTTIHDVAKKAGVSVATVSRVVNGNYPVNVKTKERVNAAIQELNFVPNVQAQEIKLGASKTIGVIVPSIDNMFFSEVVNGIERALNEKSYSLLITFSKNDQESELACVRNLVARNVAGIIIADPVTENMDKQNFSKIVGNVPIVFINGDPSHSEFSFVLSDEAKGISEALAYFWQQGRHDILFVRGADSYSYDIKEEVFKQFCDRHNLHATARMIYSGEGNSAQIIEQTKDILVPILQEHVYDAIFCCNELMAMGVIDACQQLQLSIPDDVALIGFDNTLLSKYSNPKLTTVDQHMHLLGYNAGGLVLENIETGQRGKRIVLNTSLIVRDSTTNM